MFECFKKEKPTKPVTVVGNVEVEDLEVSFLCGNEITPPQKHTKVFKSLAMYYPAMSDQDSGVFVDEAERKFGNFMSHWKANEFAIINDAVIRFSAFISAEISRSKRTMECRMRANAEFSDRAEII